MGCGDGGAGGVVGCVGGVEGLVVSLEGGEEGHFEGSFGSVGLFGGDGIDDTFESIRSMK